MTAEPDQEALAVLCAALPHLRTLLRGPASGARRAVLTRTLTAARRGEPIAGFLAELGLESAESDQDPADTRSTLPTPLATTGRPVVGGYVCPRGTCTRLVRREADADLPTCDIHEQALRFVAED
ncbi:hypothetical protein [Nonomuraea jiangxiensis]|uniref:Uncharacterized protein n=1 Tax=Nonomuraea jiangxiensis TaxID=633440 RepID=A0A1G8JPC9_9ACTN|nr:hypothetical protein [Nonomuraea jiangxiensis]SDI33078.1 hypothetical protein SAMN05421869_105147 [Nonomuraea jiangxiensis]